MTTTACEHVTVSVKVEESGSQRTLNLYQAVLICQVVVDCFCLYFSSPLLAWHLPLSAACFGGPSMHETFYNGGALHSFPVQCVVLIAWYQA